MGERDQTDDLDGWFLSVMSGFCDCLAGQAKSGDASGWWRPEAQLFVDVDVCDNDKTSLGGKRRERGGEE